MRNEVDKHLSWFLSRMKPSSTRLIKMIVNPKAFGDKAPNTSDMDKEKNEFYNLLLKSLDGQLKGKKFFCGDEMTIADLQYYNEIMTITHLAKRPLTEADYPNLAPWLNERMQIAEIVAVDKRFKDIVGKYNLL